jgi:hypothetical protein
MRRWTVTIRCCARRSRLSLSMRFRVPTTDCSKTRDIGSSTGEPGNFTGPQAVDAEPPEETERLPEGQPN